MEADDKIQYALAHTEVIRPPKQSLATFGTTNIYYYLITELTEVVNVVREGRVIAERPRIVTPSYLIHLEGFSPQARRFIEMMAEKYPHEPEVLYKYKNEPKEMNIVSGPLPQIVDTINTRLNNQGDPLSAIIKGVEEVWDVSLLKFTFELTRRTLRANIAELERSGLLDIDEVGIPRDARRYIDELFAEVKRDLFQAPKLAAELQRWGLFSEYQDRFFSLFQKQAKPL